MKRAMAVGLLMAMSSSGVAVAVPGDLVQASLTDAGAQPATASVGGVVSGNGRYVAFVSDAALTGVPTGAKKQVYVRDLVGGRTRLASAAADGTVANGDADPGAPFDPFLDITPDGRHVVFRSDATNLVPGDANAQPDVFRKDMTTGAVTLVSVSTGGAQGNDFSSDPSISADGNRVAFVTGATNLLPADGNAAMDVLLRDIAAGTTTLVSSNTAGQQANDFSERPAISADGRVVAFEAGPMTDNLYPGDSNAVNDVIVKHLVTGVAVPAAVKVGAGTMSGADVGGGNMPDISGDGRYVVFQTGSTLDPATDANGANDVYRRDVVTGVTTLASGRNGLPTAGNQGGTSASITADGSRVGFDSSSTDLVTGDNNNQIDAFARTIGAQETLRLSQRADGTEVVQASDTAGVSADGGRDVFTTTGAFAATDGNNVEDVYAKELTPTDTAGPVFSSVATVSSPLPGHIRGIGALSDPSGIGRVAVAGGTVTLAADNTFAADVPYDPAAGVTISVSAMDGAGNVATETATVAPRTTSVVAPPAPPGMPPRPRISNVLVGVLRTRVVVRFRVSRTAGVQGMLQRRVLVRRRVVRNGVARIVRVPRWVRAGAVRTVALRAGNRRIIFVRPTRPGVYRARLIATNAGGRHVFFRGFVVRPIRR